MTRESAMQFQQLKWLSRPLHPFDPAVHQARIGAPSYVNNFLFLKPPGTASGAGA